MASLVTLSGEFDIFKLPELRHSLGAALERDALVSVDMSGVTFIDSGGWQVINQAAQVANRLGGRVTLHGVRESQRAVLTLLGLHAVLDVHPLQE